MKKIFLANITYRIVFLFLVSFAPTNYLFAQPMTVDFLNDIAKTYYEREDYNSAIAEFNKVLILDPENKIAKEYLASIKKLNASMDSMPMVSRTSDTEKDRSQAIENALRAVQPKSPGSEKQSPEDESGEHKSFVSGEILASFGATSKDFYWKRANGDLNEKNWRIRSYTALNNGMNTYDPRIFDRVKLDLDTDNSNFNLHSNITVDPWSVTGKSNKVTLQTTGGDLVDVQLKYWSNSGYTINEIAYTLKNGLSFALPEIKVHDDKIQSTTITNGWGDTLRIPEMEIKYDFQPMRELWFDYQENEAFKLRVFPIAYEDQAFTSDDPLGLSNHRIYWEESPWLDSWQSGHVNTGASPQDFSTGYWDDSLSFFTRDSDMTRLTALRGASFNARPTEDTDINVAFASPKTLWQDYDVFDTYSGAFRIKQIVSDDFSFGFTSTAKAGYNKITDSRSELDALNNVYGADFGYQPFLGGKAVFEGAFAKEKLDRTNAQYRSKDKGNSYQAALVTRYPSKDIIDSSYDQIIPEENEDSFIKTRIMATRMEDGFKPGLATYSETKSDQFWGRHITFKRPMDYYITGWSQPSSYNDIKSFRIGDSIDSGRDVLAFRTDMSFLKGDLEQLFDVRNAHNSNNGKFIENVARTETVYKINKKLTAKLLGIWQAMHKTIGGKDPFLYNSVTREYYVNSSIQDGEDPSLKTGSLGAEYAFTDKLALSGVWERTNDSTVAAGNFPRGVFDGSWFGTYQAYGNVYRNEPTYVYNQGFYPAPPYKYFDIFKAGLRVNPTEKLQLYFDWTRNENRHAGPIDDNMNHLGFEGSYAATSKWSLYARYVYSKFNDIEAMTAGQDKIYRAHHNTFFESRYKFSADDEFSLQFGESARTLLGASTFDPFGGSMTAVDTQHIVRAYYRRKF